MCCWARLHAQNRTEISKSFFDSLAFVDKTYEELHGPQETRYSTLGAYPPSRQQGHRNQTPISPFFAHYVKRAGVSMALYG